MGKLTALALGTVLALGAAAPSNAVTISNTRTGSRVSTFGFPDTKTYGEVFTAPITGLLTSFTLSLNGNVGSLYGGVGTWNGPATYQAGHGSPVNLYQSANVLSTSAQSFTFSPNVAVVAGSQYVAYLSVFGDADATTTTSMPLGTTATGLDYFVFNNATDPRNNPAWDYFFNAGNVAFSADFGPAAVAAAPEPATWALMLLAFGMAGVALRRKAAGDRARLTA